MDLMTFVVIVFCFIIPIILAISFSIYFKELTPILIAFQFYLMLFCAFFILFLVHSLGLWLGFKP